MNGIIFLDIDGVINIINELYSTQFDTDRISEPHLMIYLNYIVEKLDAEIVVSSSRRVDLNLLKNQLREEGFLYCDRIVGSTEINSKKRGEQIQDYINTQSVEEYLVLDDEISGINGIDGKFIP